MSIYRLITLLTILLFLSACSRPTDDTNILINIENEFTVSLIETLSPEVNPLNLRVATIELQDCSNYEIANSSTTTQESVVASIDYIQEPENCIPGLHPATSDISLGKLDNGSYLFQLNLEKGSIINEGTLTINDDQYSIELDTDHGIHFPVKTLNKIPGNYIWGEVNIAPNAPNDLMDELMAEINQITEESTLPSGEYGHFKIDNDLDFNFTTNKFISFSPDETKSFILKLTDTSEALKDIVENFRETFSDKIDIQLITSEGEVL